MKNEEWEEESEERRMKSEEWEEESEGEAPIHYKTKNPQAEPRDSSYENLCLLLKPRRSLGQLVYLEQRPFFTLISSLFTKITFPLEVQAW